ncbi:hypothetical protein REC12_14250 [Desulfosporosinus sp. PR]|nr:hypothetical protein [Desulfosporosinus sp. PR]
MICAAHHSAIAGTLDCEESGAKPPGNTEVNHCPADSSQSKRTGRDSAEWIRSANHTLPVRGSTGVGTGRMGFGAGTKGTALGRCGRLGDVNISWIIIF